MAINFPNNPVNGNTYKYNEVTYIYSKSGTDEGYWKVSLPQVSGVATPDEVDAGLNMVKYISPFALAESGYVRNINDALVLADGSTTARDLSERFTDVVNMKDFGAVGDGSTDDTLAVQAAFNAGANNLIFGNAGRYRITAPIIIKSTTSYKGSTACVFIHDYIQATEKGEDSMFRNEHYGDNNRLDTNIHLDGLTFETGPNSGRGCYLAFNRAENISVTNLLSDKTTGGFTMWISAKNVLLNNIKIFSQYPGISNSDGIHFEYIENLLANNLNIASEDDCLGLAYFPLDGIYTNPAGRDKPSKNLTFTNCVLSSTSNGIRLGNTTLLGLAKDNLYHIDARFEKASFSNVVFEKVGNNGFCIDMYEVRQNSAAPNSDIRFNNMILTDDTSANQMIRIEGNPYTAGLVPYAGNENIRNYNRVFFSGLSGNNGSFAPTMDAAGITELTVSDMNVYRSADTDNEFVTQLVDYLYINDSKIRGRGQDATSNIFLIRDFLKVVINDTLINGNGNEVAGVRLWQENYLASGIVNINRSEIRKTVGGVLSINALELDELFVDAIFDITGVDRNTGLTSIRGDRGTMATLASGSSAITNDVRKHGDTATMSLVLTVTNTIASGSTIATFPDGMIPATQSRFLSFDTASPANIYPFEINSTGAMIARRGIPAGIYFFSATYSTSN